MKMFLKSRIFVAIITACICITGTAYAAGQILASDISYRDGTVESALNDLYSKADNQTMDGTVCMLVSGTKNTVGAKYVCNPGDGILRNFFILKVDGNNVKLIMERNMSDTVGNVRMNYTTAANYLKSGGQGYSTVLTWNRVQSVDLPSAQDIVDASLIINPKSGFIFNISNESETWWCLGSHGQDQPDGPSYCPTSLVQQTASWLFDYTIDCGSRGCSNSLSDNNSNSYGYWTKDGINGDNTHAWAVNRNGSLIGDPVTNTLDGVRPVITVAKNKLAN